MAQRGLQLNRSMGLCIYRQIGRVTKDGRIIIRIERRLG
jgi:hypothetical protein